MCRRRGPRRPTVVEEAPRKMRDTAGGTPALPIEEAASSFSSPITDHPSLSRSFAVQRLSECVGAAGRVALPGLKRRSVAFCAGAIRSSHDPIP